MAVRAQREEVIPRDRSAEHLPSLVPAYCRRSSGQGSGEGEETEVRGGRQEETQRGTTHRPVLGGLLLKCDSLQITS